MRFLCVAAVLWLGAAANAGSLAELEAVTAKASDLRGFLAREDLVRAYAAAVKSYYGRDRYQCETFDEIVAQLKSLCETVPGLAERIWQRRDAGVPLAVTNGDERYLWKPVLRPLHAIWIDPSPTGCQHWSCRKADHQGPDRWAVALRDSRAYVLEKDGRYQDGALVVVPYRVHETSVGLASLSGGPAARALFDPWLSQVDGRQGVPWPAIAVIEPVRSEDEHPFVRLARIDPPASGRLGELDGLEPADPLSAAIAVAKEPACLAAFSKDKKKKKLYDASLGMPASGGGSGAPLMFMGGGASTPSLPAAQAPAPKAIDSSDPSNVVAIPGPKGPGGPPVRIILNLPPGKKKRGALPLRDAPSPAQPAPSEKDKPSVVSSVPPSSPPPGTSRNPASNPPPPIGMGDWVEPDPGSPRLPTLPWFPKFPGDTIAGGSGSADAPAPDGDRLSTPSPELSEPPTPGSPKSPEPPPEKKAPPSPPPRPKDPPPRKEDLDDPSSLIEQAAREADPAKRDRDIKRFADIYLDGKNGDAAYKALLDAAGSHPGEVSGIFDAINGRSKDVCRAGGAK